MLDMNHLEYSNCIMTFRTAHQGTAAVSIFFFSFVSYCFGIKYQANYTPRNTVAGYFQEL